MNFRLAEGARIEETTKVVETILATIPKVVDPNWIRHTYAKDGEDEEGYGVALGFEQGPNVGEVRFKLIDRDQRERIRGSGG